MAAAGTAVGAAMGLGLAAIDVGARAGVGDGGRGAGGQRQHHNQSEWRKGLSKHRVLPVHFLAKLRKRTQIYI